MEKPYSTMEFQPCFLLLAKFRQKAKFKNWKLESEVVLRVFKRQKWGKKLVKIKIKSIFGSECVAKNIQGWLKFCIAYGVYSQIWLNFPKASILFTTNFFLGAFHLSKNNEDGSCQLRMVGL
jgi:hypothetical protein